MSVLAKLTQALMNTLGRWPLAKLHRWGFRLGNTIWALRLPWRKYALRNLAFCFPQMDKAERTALAKSSLQQTGCLMLETAAIWGSPPEKYRAQIVEVIDEYLLDAAQAKGGVIVIVQHLGCWELLNWYMSARGGFGCLYRPPRMAWLEQVIRNARSKTGSPQFRAEAAGMRELLRFVKQGGTVGILPDQRPTARDGIFAAFFGRSALTMTLLPKLAKSTGASLVYAFVERLENARGFRVHILPADPAIAGDDMDAALAAMNRGVETCVMKAPHQYQWTYRRFKDTPPGEATRDLYD